MRPRKQPESAGSIAVRIVAAGGLIHCRLQLSMMSIGPFVTGELGSSLALR
jgi:hypothetical protein